MFVKIVSLVFLLSFVQGREIIDNLDAQLKLINKPALKSFQTEYGDIIDCIDIYKQLAFDHPLLKNHQIQMKPETAHPEEMTNTPLNYMPENIKCPPESVPIKRATREDLIMSESVKNLKGLKNPASNILSRRENSDMREGYGQALLASKQLSYGAKATLNVWSPEVSGDKQFSNGVMGLAYGPNDRITTIQAGWLVHGVISPKDSRLFVFWTNDGYKSGCFNTLCPGFVQVSSAIALGLVLPSSAYAGTQNEVSVNLYQDKPTKNWWLAVNDKNVGYWPGYVLPGMGEGADTMWWGGEAYSPPGVLSPPMGSGHFPEVGYSKSAYINKVKVIKGTEYQDPDKRTFELWVTKAYCYNIIPYYTGRSPPSDFFMYFGGNGNCTL